MDLLASIANRFQLAGTVTSVQAIESGHINDTYLVETDRRERYVLQRINHQVFCDPHGLMRNIVLVTQHLQKKLAASGEPVGRRRVLSVIATTDGDSLAETSAGDYWRMLPYIENSHTVGEEASLEEIRQAACGFGSFVAHLVDLPATQLCETIPRFHHGPSRYEAFQLAVAADVAQRVGGCEREIAVIQQHDEMLTSPQQKIDTGELPLRVTHNDAKCNNILLDNETNVAVCVIDLDTVMPGLAMWDFGDLVRTSACRAAEDEVDLSLVKVEPDRLQQAARGYLAGCQGVLTEEEVNSLADGPAYMALIMATRFLTDYLEGDTYYKTLYPRHNLDRCRNQLALLAELQQLRPTLQRVFTDAAK
ncbi:aminoglycoside phosphotransferase family protein [Aeoliella sp. ICT_H6.2]|uniref:Aminoglycoside phosphotransferase family protein n=1 Tax=Aeoliella straminimaris TaxID=2954799 RepID=A0A9X2JL39_9BACT|nr:aminoglycoside phosphotransferase family protein [Aeoliella straminimaris]MCO6048014.1 aminoglycoside phosphotransferase family protein [Aeoliella straminimaris]